MDKDFSPHVKQNKHQGDLAPALGAEEEEVENAVRDLGEVFTLDKFSESHDFSPRVYPSGTPEEIDTDPKGLSVPESAPSSKSETDKTNASSALQGKIAAAAKGNTQRKESGLSTPAS